LPFPGHTSPFTTLGIAVYKSTDGGRTWGAPNFIHPNTASVDDKQWVASDRNPSSKFFGSVYIAWDAGAQLAFARTSDRGATWTGFGNKPVGEPLAFDSFAPSIAVTDDGGIYIFWIAGSTIKFVKSTNGGRSFSNPAVVATGLTTLTAGLGGFGFPKFPGGRFRVLTLPTACAGAGQTLLVAWADYRDGHLTYLLPPFHGWRRQLAWSNKWWGTVAAVPRVRSKPAGLSPATGESPRRSNRLRFLRVWTKVVRRSALDSRDHRDLE
jgi:hypothetical protein